MPTYFPFLRGKQNELIAVRELSGRIADSSAVRPIIEPVNGNATTIGALNEFYRQGMQFGLIVNPSHGEFAGNEARLLSDVIKPTVLDYDNFFPILQVDRNTSLAQVEWFKKQFPQEWKAVIYRAMPEVPRVLDWVTTDARIYHHIFLDGRVSGEYVTQVPAARRVMIRDNFNKQERNKDYELVEHFTDMNTLVGNPEGVGWGDFSIVGSKFSEGGGQAYAVAIHHVHQSQNGDHLDVSHAISDRQDTDEDTPGKVIEAVNNLLSRVENLYPNDTSACREYQKMSRTGVSRGLGYLKRLAIRHHLEIFLPQ
ncbi:sce7725 family protein [Luteolibacter sp. GHJ8]|uniref:Sce7725 family protein n=1 Tax=Luteolibacter rhizosphaerae TaxID=2989719 RepID=A0ABT3G2F8_9BACT|nr:sce7725 family protein [Luteolibacter rhizosphaerae]MCW1913749.1 sce7725 family protein [Luteolibacter rhizosphaerae]